MTAIVVGPLNAEQVLFTPEGSIEATNVEGALLELAFEDIAIGVAVNSLGTAATADKVAAGVAGVLDATDAATTNARTPTDGSVTDAKVAVGAAIAEAKIALASDAATGTPSRRTLGIGATQAASGNDARFADVRDYGAIGDGVSRPLSTLYGTLAAAQVVYPHATALTDELDWAGLQACANARLLVRLPVGSYRLGVKTLDLRNGSHLLGEAQGMDVSVPAVRIISDCAAYTPAVRIASGAVTLGMGVTIENIWISGNAVDFIDYANYGVYSSGLLVGPLSEGLTVRNVTISGFTYNALLHSPRSAVLDNLRLQNAIAGNLSIYSFAMNVSVRGGRFTVVNESGTANAATTVFNVAVVMVLNQRPALVDISNCIIDEIVKPFGVAPVTNSVLIDSADDVSVNDCIIYTPINSLSGANPAGGNGVYIKGDSKRTTLRGLHIEPYALDANHVPAQTVLVAATATDTRLTDISTVANGGGDVSDLATDTQWINVNGVTKLQGIVSNTAPIALGTAAAGTGSAAARDDHVHPTTGLVKTSGTQTITGPTTHLASAIADVPLVAKAMVGQTANLQEWQNSVGTIVASIGSIGVSFFRGMGINISPTTINSVLNTMVVQSLYNSAVPLSVRGLSGQTANLQDWKDSGGSALVTIDKDGLATLSKGAVITCASAASVGLRVNAATSQTANLTEWRDSAGVVKAYMNSTWTLECDFMRALAIVYTDTVQSRSTGHINFVGNPLLGGRYMQADEMIAPAAPAVNQYRLFAQDNGAGKTQLCVRFATGVTQILATEP